ncbi:MAG: hypothetical protein LBP63_05505 [Prevotellaceae bacterium]|jgi:hypothetical protein|nr:hypothetical protein [Prevotellaceae bacterium]
MRILKYVQDNINNIKECELINDYNEKDVNHAIDCCLKLFHSLLCLGTCSKRSIENKIKAGKLIREVNDRIRMICKSYDL